MKTIPQIILMTMTVALAQPQESGKLWPEGRESDVPELHRYLPGPGEGNGAAVVICPGGGYGGLAVDHEGHQVANWFLERGVAAFVLHYRLGSQGHHHPAQLADVQRGLRTVRGQAGDCGIDPSRIGVMGFSAGGHLASMAATLFDETVYEAEDEIDGLSARPDFAILCYPVISMDSQVAHRGSRRNLLGPGRADDDEAAARVSSEKNVSENTPPTFLFHTVEDAAVPVENSLSFFAAMRRYGVPGELHAFEKGPHGVGLFRGDPVLRHWSELLDHWLRNSGFYAGEWGRAALSGTVDLDGSPVSWGSLTFYPDDEALPVTTIRVRRGQFAADENGGPVAAPSRIVFEGSIWEGSRDAEDGLVHLESLRPGGGALRFAPDEGSGEVAWKFYTD